MQPKADSVVIQKVTAQNFQDFLDLVAALANYEKLPPPDTEAQQRLQRDCLGKVPKFYAFIAQLEGKTVGYVSYFFNYSSFLAVPTLYIEDIFVLEKYRRKGVGKKLFDYLKAVAKEEGCGRIEFTVLEWNTVAQQFYEKNGAHRLEWFFYRIVRAEF
jgi:GNAT superfamily N-acetyltransferase